MKTILKSIIAITILITASSCVLNGITGNRNVQSVKRSISGDFIKIKAANGLHVFLTYQEDPSVVVEADENLHDIIVTEVIDGTLHIHTKKNIVSASAKNVYVSATHLNEIETSSGADMISENTIDTDELTLSVSSGSDMELRVDITNLQTNSSSGGDVKLIGRTKNLDVSASSGSDVKAYGLEVMNCKARASSGADIKISVSKKLDAKATSGADINYKGHPEIVQLDETAAGDIKNIDG